MLNSQHSFFKWQSPLMITKFNIKIHYPTSIWKYDGKYWSYQKRINQFRFLWEKAKASILSKRFILNPIIKVRDPSNVSKCIKNMNQNIPWPINICKKNFITPAKTFCSPPIYLMYVPLLSFKGSLLPLTSFNYRASVFNFFSVFENNFVFLLPACCPTTSS